MGMPKPAFTCIRTKSVDNVQRWVDRGSDGKERLLFSLFVCFNLGHVIKASAQTFLTVKLNF